MAIGSDGKLYAVGWSSGVRDVTDAVLAVFDTDGTLIWDRSFGEQSPGEGVDFTALGSRLTAARTFTLLDTTLIRIMTTGRS